MIYDIFAFTIIFAGLGSFIFLLSRAIFYRKQPTLFVNLFILALCGLYVSIVYILMGFSIRVENMTIGVYIRPVLILFLVIPSFNIYRMKP